MYGFRDTERLITQVRERRALWDPTCDTYKDRDKRAEEWTAICMIRYPGFQDMEETEQLRICRELQTRWKSLRDSYSRNLKKTRGKDKRKYVFADQLSFLDRVLQSKEVIEALESSSHDPDSQDALPSEGKQARDRSVSPSLVSETRSLSPGPSEKKKRKRSLEERLLHCIDRSSEKKDPDNDFFNSLLPTVKNFTEDQKLEFRIEVLLLVQKLKSSGTSKRSRKQFET